jgi:hypothetical protein
VLCTWERRDDRFEKGQNAFPEELGRSKFRHREMPRRLRFEVFQDDSCILEFHCSVTAGYRYPGSGYLQMWILRTVDYPRECSSSRTPTLGRSSKVFHSPSDEVAQPMFLANDRRCDFSIIVRHQSQQLSSFHGMKTFQTPEYCSDSPHSLGLPQRERSPHLGGVRTTQRNSRRHQRGIDPPPRRWRFLRGIRSAVRGRRAPRPA